MQLAWRQDVGVTDGRASPLREVRQVVERIDQRPAKRQNRQPVTQADDRLDAIRAVLGEVRALVDERAVWCAPMREIAAWVREHPEAGSWALRLDQE